MRSWPEPAVELRLGRISARLAQDLVGLPQVAILPLQGFQPLGDFCPAFLTRIWRYSDSLFTINVLVLIWIGFNKGDYKETLTPNGESACWEDVAARACLSSCRFGDHRIFPGSGDGSDVARPVSLDVVGPCASNADHRIWRPRCVSSLVRLVAPELESSISDIKTRVTKRPNSAH